MDDRSHPRSGERKPPKAHRRETDDRQLDLFAIPKEPSSAPVAPVPSPPPPESEPEAESPGQASATSPDIAAEVRAALSESAGTRLAMSPADSTQPPLPSTGIYRRPRILPLGAAPPPRPSFWSRWPLGQRIRNWFAGAEITWPFLAAVGAVAIVIAILAHQTARPKPPAAKPGTILDLEGQHKLPPADLETEPMTPAAPLSPSPKEQSSPQTAPLAEPKPPPSISLADWSIPGGEATLQEGGIHLRFAEPVFVSADRISVEGMKALKAVGNKLAGMTNGVRVIVIGHTDDIPLSRPTAEFRNNTELAAARARAASEHLAHFARANKALHLEHRAGRPAETPYPNDSPQNRRRNRTVTLQIVPTP